LLLCAGRAAIDISRPTGPQLQTRRTLPDRPTDTTPWASAHSGKWGQLTPLKMDEKLKSENMQKEQFSEWGVGVK